MAGLKHLLDPVRQKIMANIAVAGGTGSVGRTLREVLETKHKVVGLARRGGKGLIATDYSNVDATAETLRDQDVNTVVCAISVGDATSSDAQLRLIEAAAKSGTVKRFIVSEWGIVHKPDSPSYNFRQDSYAALRKTSLEWTRVANGFFIDYWGISKGLKSHMAPHPDWAVDIAHKKAALPGSGDDAVCFTYTYDMARYLSSWLASGEKWEETTYLYGEKTTWNDFVKEAEAITGSKFEVAYDPWEKLEKGETTELPSHVPCYTSFPKPALQGLLAMFSRWALQGVFDLPEEKALNKKFPDIHTTKVKDVLALHK